MINFFRKIRLGLLIENKVIKYLLYAIGEILLVVIGILIALNINNTNEANKLKQREVILLTEIRKNLQQDLLILNSIIIANKKKIHSNEMVKLALQTNQPFNDSLKYHFGYVFGYFHFNGNLAAWENVKSIGLDLISNDSLRNSISYLYSSRYKYMEKLEKDVDIRYQWNQLYPQILKHLNIDTLWVSGTPENYEELIHDREFLEVIKMNIWSRNYMEKTYNNGQKNIAAVLEQVDNHIKYLNK